MILFLFDYKKINFLCFKVGVLASSSPGPSRLEFFQRRDLTIVKLGESVSPLFLLFVLLYQKRSNFLHFHHVTINI